MNVLDYPALGETVYEDRLPNGLRLLTVKKPGFHKTFAMFATRYGGADRRFRVGSDWVDTPAGVAHFLEHKMFDMPDGSNVLSELSARGASPNAYTGSDMTAYHITCTDDFADSLEILLRYVSTPWYTAESVAKEQGIIAQEIRMREDQPGRRVRTELMKALYARHPVREGNLGTEESIARITPDLLYGCHESFYRPDNMVLCCAGNVDPESILSLAARLLPEKPRRKPPERDRGEEADLAPVRVRTETEMPVSMPVFLLGSKLPFAPEGKDWQRRLLLAELSCDLFLGEGSPLYAALYDGGAINRSFSAGVTDFPAGESAARAGAARIPRRCWEGSWTRRRPSGRTGRPSNGSGVCRRPPGAISLWHLILSLTCAILRRTDILWASTAWSPR